MKLRSIRLDNVRRFAGTTVCLDGLGDGLNLVSAPNEAGKSTVFEALQALLFTLHRSGGAEARALRPYAGGAPEVAAEVEIDGALYRITKRWLQRPFARVTELPAGRVVAQDDEAEDWIATRIAGDGPAELLWVRQGMLALEPEGRTPAEKTEQERLARIRRDLLSSVAEELDAVTGGRKLDAIAARCAAALAELATGGGKPKAGGRWATAEKEAEALRHELALLDARCDELAAALADRARVRDDLAAARDPAAARARAEAVAAAERALEAGLLHRSRLDAAREAQRAAALERDAAADALAHHDRAAARRDAAAREAADAGAAFDRAAAAHATARAQEAAAEAEGAEARAAHAAARGALDAAERAARGNEAAARVADLGDRLARATALAAAADAADADAAAAAVTDADVRAARAAAADLDRARARVEAGAVSIAVDYLPEARARVTLDGRPLEPGEAVACPGPTTLELPGLGRLTLTPGGDAASAARAAAAAEAALDAILAPTGAPDLAALVARAERRAEAEGRSARARAELAGLAPEGTAALAAEIARLGAAAADADPDAADPATAAAAEAGTRTALAAAEAAVTAAREARLAAAHAETAAAGRQAETGRASAAADAEAAAQPARRDLAARLEALRAAAEAAEGAAGDLARALPDTAALSTALDGARATVTDARARLHDLEKHDERLATLIATRAGEGVEERRAETAGRLEAAEARASGYAAEVRALARLRDALAAARADARERYLAPLTAELAPLLAQVLDGAALDLDPRRLVPEALARNGEREDIAALSGGTREQVAILARLAFARLLARAGRATPVILDDALVYADDARFARMIAAVEAVATDVQVIVLTCRGRAFDGIAARRPALVPDDAETAAASRS